MRESPQEVLEDTDLAGPLVFCLIFGGTLLLAGKVHFNYIYGIGVLGCLGIYTLLSLMAPEGVAPTCVVSVLGYCMLPMCVLSTVGIVFSLNLYARKRSHEHQMRKSERKNFNLQQGGIILKFFIVRKQLKSLTVENRSTVGVLLTVCIVLWSAASSSKLFVRVLNMQKQRLLVGYPCALVYAVFALLTK
ncbi:hypothetical protein ACTXT7_008295 [Hymenolepis weldensis]